MPRTYYLIYSHSKAARMGRQPRPRHPPPQSVVMAFEGSQGHATGLASHPRGMPQPRPHANVVIPLPLGSMQAKALVACP